MADEERIIVEGEDTDEGNNPLENLEDFANEEEKPEEAEETVEEPVTEEEPESQEKKDKIPVKLPAKEIPATEKEEHAWGRVKKENTLLKAENVKLIAGFEALEARLAVLENSESTRGLESKKAQYTQSYLDDGFKDEIAVRLAERDIRADKLELELADMKKQPDKSKADIKTQTEQSMLYKMQKGQKSKVELPVSQQANTIKMTGEQKRLYDMARKTPWGKDMKASEFIKSYNDL